MGAILSILVSCLTKLGGDIVFIDRPKHVRLLNEVMRNYNHRLQKRLNQHGIYRGQHFVLFYLIKNPGATPSIIASEFGISKSSIGSSIVRMQKNGLIVKVVDERDARRYCLFVTDKGKAVAKACAIEVEAVQNCLFSSFTENELEQANNLFNRMLESLNERGK